jgi:hypothetical protein
MTMTGCMGGIGLSGITGGDSATGADDITGGNNASEDSDAGDSGTATEPESAPVAVMPGAFLQGGSLAFKSDSGDNVPVIGLENAIADFADGDQVIISDIELEAEVACLEKGSPAFAQGYGAASLVKKISNLVISEAHAEETAASICDDEDKTCCPIQDDGSFECFYPLVDQSVASVFISVVDEEGNYVTDEVTEETIQPNLMYVKNAPSDVAELDGSLFSLGNSKGTSFVTDAESELRVDEYEKFEAEGSKLGFSTNDGLVGVLDDNVGIRLYEKDGDDITDTTEVDTFTDATEYTFFRPINNLLYYGYEQEASEDAHLEAATTPELEDPTKHLPRHFLQTGDGVFHTKTLSYDSTTYGWGDIYSIVSFIDNSNNLRLRLVQNYGDLAEERLDNSTWKTTSEANVKDIQIYYDNDTAEAINFVVLDDMNNKVRVGSYDLGAATVEHTLDDNKAIDVGSSAKSMHFSSDSGKLYVLSQGAKNVAVIPLMSDTETIIADPKTEAESDPDFIKYIDLTGLITNYAEKGITLSPNSMTFLDGSDKLIVGDATTRAAIEVDVSAYETALE